MNLIKKGPLWILISALLITSCNLPSEESGNATQTALFETVVAGITQTTAAKPTNTITPPPSPTLPLIPPTTNPLQLATVPPFVPTVAVTPCNRATFVADVTIPDGSTVNPGSTFKKTWRLQNSGTCTWTSGYTVVYVAGERMGAPESEAFTTGTVAPGASVDIDVDLTAPTTAGKYTGYFRLRSADGIQFGVLTNASGTFYVQISVSGGTATSGVSPTISSMSPASVTVNSADFILTVNGANYVSGAVVKMGTTSLTTNYVSATKVTATVLYQYVKTVGTYAITVVNPGGATSAAANFYVTAASNPAPTMGSINPSSANAGAGAFSLAVSGSNFVSGAQVLWNGSALSTTFGSSTSLSAAVTAGLVASAGTYNVTVINPAPGGGTSAAATFTVNTPSNPVPVVGGVGALGSDPPHNIFVTGSSYVDGATVNMDGSAISTKFVNAAELHATIPTDQWISGNTYTFTVTNPGPGGGLSTTQASFTIP